MEKLRNENIVLNNKMLEAIKNNQILIAYQDTILNNYEKLSQEELLQGYNSGYAKSGDLSIFVSNKFAKQKSEERIKREESNAQTSSPKLKVELVGKSLKLEIDNGNKYTTTTTFDVDETVTGSLVGSYVGMIPNVDLKELPVANYKLFTNRKYNISNAEIENQINKFAKNILKEHPELKPQFDREFEAKLREIEEDVLDIANEEEEKFNNDKELAKQSFLQKRAEEIERFNKSKIDMINNQKSSNIEKTTIININSDKDGISDVIENNKRVVIVNNASINTSAIDVNKALAKINLDSIINAAQEQVKNANIQVQKANFDNYRKDIEKYKGNLKQYFDMNNINMDFDITVDTASCFPNEASNGKTEKEVRVFKFSNGSNTFAMPNIPNMPVIPAIPNIPTINIPIINLKPLDLNKMLAIKVIKGQDEYIFWYENSSEVLDKLPKDKIEDLSKELEILNNSKSVCEADIDKNKAILDVWKGCSANLNEMKVYPNPAVNQFNIDFTSSKVANCNIYIADLTGKNLQTLNGSYSTTVGMNSLNFNVNNLTSGMYYVIIESEFGDIIQQRLIIK